MRKCAGRIRYVHASYMRDAPSGARRCKTKEELVQRIYNDWGGQSHNEILVNLDHSMVCGLWSDEYSTHDLKILQEMFADKYGRILKLFVITNDAKMIQLEDMPAKGGPVRGLLDDSDDESFFSKLPFFR